MRKNSSGLPNPGPSPPTLWPSAHDVSQLFAPAPASNPKLSPFLLPLKSKVCRPSPSRCLVPVLKHGLGGPRCWIMAHTHVVDALNYKCGQNPSLGLKPPPWVTGINHTIPIQLDLPTTQKTFSVLKPYLIKYLTLNPYPLNKPPSISLVIVTPYMSSTPHIYSASSPRSAGHGHLTPAEFW